MAFEREDLNLEATELRLGLPGTDQDQSKEKKTPPGVKTNKRALAADVNEGDEFQSNANSDIKKRGQETAPPSKSQVVGWPPVRSYRKNCFQAKKTETEASGIYVKISMDGAPYLRKMDVKVYKGYSELLRSMEDMFKIKVGDYCEREGYSGSEYVPTYEDKDGDWMLVGDVPWEMFITSCKRLRIMKSSEARGLGCAV
ncbi:hypothetical protein FNV43_RR04765 [Rhamnella rubrinervis]|uniref:Auxin-responsive protein n=1 Tax=Rhamnella rubrinervis TaxID=2594499 RepID=A0A8K0HMK8_9ROSA|nr:hypothetical protein FNV43_RR04765 [Rhamnella rubrinervis]